MSSGQSGAPSAQGRREFLQQIPAVVACVCAGSALSLMGCAGAKYVNTAPTPDGRLLVRRSEIGDGTSAVLQWSESNIPIFLYRVPDSANVAQQNANGETWRAVWMSCTHRGCQVEPGADKLVCPCHGSEFALDGRVLQGPARQPLRSFAVTIEGEHLVLRKVESHV